MEKKKESKLSIDPLHGLFPFNFNSVQTKRSKIHSEFEQPLYPLLLCTQISNKATYIIIFVGKKGGQKCLSNYSSTIYSPEWNQVGRLSKYLCHLLLKPKGLILDDNVFV